MRSQLVIREINRAAGKVETTLFTATYPCEITLVAVDICFGDDQPKTIPWVFCRVVDGGTSSTPADGPTGTEIYANTAEVMAAGMEYFGADSLGSITGWGNMGMSKAFRSPNLTLHFQDGDELAFVTNASDTVTIIAGTILLEIHP